MIFFVPEKALVFLYKNHPLLVSVAQIVFEIYVLKVGLNSAFGATNAPIIEAIADQLQSLPKNVAITQTELQTEDRVVCIKILT